MEVVLWQENILMLKKGLLREVCSQVYLQVKEKLVKDAKEDSFYC